MSKLGEVTSKISDLLAPLSSEDQQRVVHAALTLLGNAPQRTIPDSSSPAASQQREGTINVVTAELGADSCRKILVAAAVHLALFEGKSKWTKQEWISRAAEARDWKTVYSPQVSRDLGRLIKTGAIVERSKDTFSLPSSTLLEMQSKF